MFKIATKNVVFEQPFLDFAFKGLKKRIWLWKLYLVLCHI